MKLASKIVAVCLVAMMLITALSVYWIAQREFQLVEEIHQSNAQRIGSLIRESIDLVYKNEGQQGIIKVIKTHAVDTGEIQYRWVWLDVSVNDPTCPAAPMESLSKIMNGEMDSVITAQQGPDILHTYYPIDVNDKVAGKPRKGAVELTGSLHSAEQEAWRTAKTGLIAMSMMAVFCLGIIAWSGVRFVGKPLEKLTEQTRRIGNGEYDSSLEISSNDEFGELSKALHALSEQITAQQAKIQSEISARIETIEQLRHADRLKTVGRLAAGVAHEVGTPLNVISGRAGLIRSGKLNQQELEDSAAAIQSEANRITGIVRQLMDFARKTPLKRQSADLRGLIERTIQLLQTMAEKNNVTIQLSYEEQQPFTAFLDESQIQQVLTNIIVNAIQAMPATGQIDVRLKNVPEKHLVQVEIQDDGPGMDADTLNQIFEPFFTTKDVGQGTGLGLSIAHGIIDEHGGQIVVESQPGSGTTFRISLPKTETAE